MKLTETAAGVSIDIQTAVKGSKADLELTDPDSILDSGVDIIAQPPGKSRKPPVVIRGERALAAIAYIGN